MLVMEVCPAFDDLAELGMPESFFLFGIDEELAMDWCSCGASMADRPLMPRAALLVSILSSSSLLDDPGSGSSRLKLSFCCGRKFSGSSN